MMPLLDTIRSNISGPSGSPFRNSRDRTLEIHVQPPHTATMASRYALSDVPDQHMLACAAKLVAMLIHAREEDDAFTCLFSIQGSIEVFAAQAATPIEHALAESMRAMSAEMMRRSQGRQHHHAIAARSVATENTRHTVRFKRRRGPRT